MHFVQYHDEVTFQYVTILLSKSRKLWTVSVSAHKIEIVARILLCPKFVIKIKAKNISMVFLASIFFTFAFPRYNFLYIFVEHHAPNEAVVSL